MACPHFGVNQREKSVLGKIFFIRKILLKNIRKRKIENSFTYKQDNNALSGGTNDHPLLCSIIP